MMPSLPLVHFFAPPLRVKRREFISRTALGESPPQTLRIGSNESLAGRLVVRGITGRRGRFHASEGIQGIHDGRRATDNERERETFQFRENGVKYG